MGCIRSVGWMMRSERFLDGVGLFLGSELHSEHTTTRMWCLVHVETSLIPWE